jgi:hypothetical protein
VAANEAGTVIYPVKEKPLGLEVAVIPEPIPLLATRFGRRYFIEEFS